MSISLKYIGATLTLLFLGMLLVEPIFDFSYSQIESESVKIISRNTPGQYYSKVIFVTAIGLIPFLYSLFQRMTRVKFLYNGLIAFMLIVSSGFSLWGFRVFQLKSRSKVISAFYSGKVIEKDLRWDSLKINEHYFEYYLLFGFFIGTILCMTIFKYLYKPAIK